jgi:hypothetical protein
VSDPVHEAVIEHLRQPSRILMHPNDVVSLARASLAGYNLVPAIWEGDLRDIFLTDAILAQIVRRSEADADMWDACVLAVKRFFERREVLPEPLAKWNLDVLNGNKPRPTIKGGARDNRALKNLARDMKICGAVALAAKLGGLDEYAQWGGDEKSACHVVSECLTALDKEGDAAGAHLGYESVKKIWLEHRAVICSEGPAYLPMGKPIE